MIVHPDGIVYSVDMATDTLFRLDPSVPGGARESFPIPTAELPLGGRDPSGALPANTNMRVAMSAAVQNRDLMSPLDEMIRQMTADETSAT